MIAAFLVIGVVAVVTQVVLTVDSLRTNAALRRDCACPEPEST